MLNHYSTHQHKGHNMVVAVTGDSYYKLSDGLATSVGKSELCIHTWDAKRLLGVLFHSLSTHTNSEDKHTVPAHEEQRAREGGLRIWTAQQTECVLEVGWICLTCSSVSSAFVAEDLQEAWKLEITHILCVQGKAGTKPNH